MEEVGRVESSESRGRGVGEKDTAHALTAQPEAGQGQTDGVQQESG